MLKIKNTEIEFILSVDSAEENSAEFPYYSTCFILSTTLLSKEINYSATWEVYNGEIEKFKSQLINLKDKKNNDKASLTLINENSSITIEKITTPYETYLFKFRLSSSTNLNVYIQGESILDQSYISEIITGVSDLLK
ncbi:TPA: hypothetical protein JGU28_004382 [Salmonella enterica]|nr:hypothetical protein [Salmonella enterica]